MRESKKIGNEKIPIFLLQHLSLFRIIKQQHSPSEYLYNFVSALVIPIQRND